MRLRFTMLTFSLVMFFSGAVCAGEPDSVANVWNQWRGPTRDGHVPGKGDWPAKLDAAHLKQVWSVKLAPSYSGPIVSADRVYVTETKEHKFEIVRALDRKTGKEIWSTDWPGSMVVPFFAIANGSWIRATPALDGDSLYVAGMRDTLVSLDTATGKERWRIDFMKKLGTPLPAFGFVSSPLVDGDSVYVQAGASAVKVDKKTGKILWRALESKGGMMDSAFSSPVFATLRGKRQLLVQTREKLAGLDAKSGDVLWSQPVPAFRGMNILTPVVYGDSIFTSTYGNKSWMYELNKSGDDFAVKEAWSNPARGYMSTPVVIDGHAYLHLQNRRFTCIDLKTGKTTWTTEPFGQYWSMIYHKDRILALDQTGMLRLIRANPKEFELLDEREVSKQSTWAHIAVCGNEVFVRELMAMTVFRWE